MKGNLGFSCVFNVSDWLGSQVSYNGKDCLVSRTLQPNGDLTLICENGDKEVLRPYRFLKSIKTGLITPACASTNAE